MARLYVCGEALIDFIPLAGPDQSTVFAPKPGGSPYNAAMAAAMAGADVGFVGALSTDFFGDQLIDHLRAHGVDCNQTPRTDDPTTLAFVDMSTGDPRYAFYNDGTSVANMAPEATLIDPQEGDILSVGSISLIDQPGANNITEFALAKSSDMMLALDPNVRPGMINDRPVWLDRIQHLARAATLVKLSTEDLEFMAPGSSAADFAASVLQGGTSLVVVTDGPSGATGFIAGAQASAQPPEIDFVDAVGAGDTLMGSMISWIMSKGLRSSQSIGDLTENDLTDMLTFATSAAALNCERMGCNPPSLDEINAALARR